MTSHYIAPRLKGSQPVVRLVANENYIRQLVIVNFIAITFCAPVLNLVGVHVRDKTSAIIAKNIVAYYTRKRPTPVAARH